MRKILPTLNVIQRASALFSGGRCGGGPLPWGVVDLSRRVAGGRKWRPGRIVPSPAPHRPHKNRGIMRKPPSASGAHARTILPKHQNRAREPADAPPAAEDTPPGGRADEHRRPAREPGPRPRKTTQNRPPNNLPCRRRIKERAINTARGRPRPTARTRPVGSRPGPTTPSDIRIRRSSLEIRVTPRSGSPGAVGRTGLLRRGAAGTPETDGRQTATVRVISPEKGTGM